MSEHSSLIADLEAAIASGSPRKREKALELVSNLFVAGSGNYSGDQITVFGDVLTALATDIETKVRVKLSHQLAKVAHAPANVIKSLAFDDEIAVAEPVLQWSEVLSDADLVTTASTKSQDHLQAISQRRTLSESVTDILVERGNHRVVRSTAKNPGARFSDKGFGKLVARARSDEALQLHVGRRSDIPRHHFLKLLETASATVRAKIAAEFPRAAETISEVVAAVATDINTEVRSTSVEHSKARVRVKRLCMTGQFSEAEVHAFARADNFERTAVALSVFGQFPIDLVERALLDESSDTVLVLAKAAGCCWSTTKSILRLSAAGRSMSVMDMDQAQSSFDRLQVKTAKRAVEFYGSSRKPRIDAMMMHAETSAA
jgi:uncharacterized protein (DUF2336 family)